MSQTLFVTGTDTDAGKTVASVALLEALRLAGITACGFKPVASGAIATDQGLASEDALALLAGSAPGLDLASVNPVLFAPAIAPHLAAARAGQAIDPARLVSAHAALAARHAVVIAEGAGGWLTPLSDTLLLGDWVAAQGWPVLLVVRLKLGCLNHALLTAEAIASRGAKLAGWVANAAPPPSPEAAEMVATLSARLGAPLWVQDAPGAAPAVALRRLFEG
jgi:dethiobiotin synthetase